ncbi:MAG TPA: DNA mismatch repair endonuclease MutL [Methanoculleus sp.]|nr:DNA mismatch repair endonuclease MutL [Methanoculleus sp.]
MTEIHVLDPETVNQIAAGEVVERPASVAKELLENAIDAGATVILLEIASDAAGITKIQVTDNGEGMTPGEAVLAFQPHATSKIRDITDLSRIRTLGFRGEALASIAAVSEVTMVTRPRGGEALSGTRLVVRGGEIVETAEVGAPEGTTVTVERLFYNTPARRKFLKSRNTELAHVYAVVESLALAHGEIAFRVVHNGKERMATQRSAGLLATIAGLYGADLARSLLPVEGKLPFLTIRGYVSRPQENRGSPSQISLSINGRSILSRKIAAAVREGYGNLLPKDRYPVAFMDVAIDTGLVDVNVHPTKREVRLSREREILEAVTAAVRKALADHDLSRDAPEEPVQQQIVADDTPPVARETEAVYAAGHRGGPALADRRLRRTEREGEKNLLPAMEPIGQVAATYIAAEGVDGTLYLVDQHAAHERILYDQVVEQRDAESAAQELLVPVILSLSPKEAAALREAIPLLAGEGFVVEEFGRDTFAVRAVPAALGAVEDAAGTVRETIADLLSGESRAHTDQREAVTCIIACRGAIKAGTRLTPEQQRLLISQLARTKTPWTCPHGRPTVVAFDRKKLEKIFGRR